MKSKSCSRHGVLSRHSSTVSTFIAPGLSRKLVSLAAPGSLGAAAMSALTGTKWPNSFCFWTRMARPSSTSSTSSRSVRIFRGPTLGTRPPLHGSARLRLLAPGPSERCGERPAAHRAGVHHSHSTSVYKPRCQYRPAHTQLAHSRLCRPRRGAKPNGPPNVGARLARLESRRTAQMPYPCRFARIPLRDCRRKLEIHARSALSGCHCRHVARTLGHDTPQRACHYRLRRRSQEAAPVPARPHLRPARPHPARRDATQRTVLHLCPELHPHGRLSRYHARRVRRRAGPAARRLRRPRRQGRGPACSLRHGPAGRLFGQHLCRRKTAGEGARGDGLRDADCAGHDVDVHVSASIHHSRRPAWPWAAHGSRRRRGGRPARLQVSPCSSANGGTNRRDRV
ncbi:hypothetical protein CRV24_009840 [Beauveria bassiana]|nr:hypothetical protein CRV24_009840 [Beauveria bassiana]